MSDEHIPPPNFSFTFWNQRDDDTYKSGDSITVRVDLTELTVLDRVEMKVLARVAVNRTRHYGTTVEAKVHDELISSFNFHPGFAICHNTFKNLQFPHDTYHGEAASWRYFLEVKSGSYLKENEFIVINPPYPRLYLDEKSPRYLSHVCTHQGRRRWDLNIIVDSDRYSTRGIIMLDLKLKSGFSHLKGFIIRLVSQTLRNMAYGFAVINEELIEEDVVSVEYPDESILYKASSYIDLSSHTPCLHQTFSAFATFKLQYVLKIFARQQDEDDWKIIEHEIILSRDF